MTGALYLLGYYMREYCRNIYIVDGSTQHVHPAGICGKLNIPRGMLKPLWLHCRGGNVKWRGFILQITPASIPHCWKKDGTPVQFITLPQYGSVGKDVMYLFL